MSAPHSVERVTVDHRLPGPADPELRPRQGGTGVPPHADAAPSTESGGDLLGRRRRKLATTGWGARSRLVQPHTAFFWIYLALLVTGVWSSAGAVVSRVGDISWPDTASLLATGLVALLVLLLVHRSDRWKHTPGTLALAAFLIGGLASLYSKVFGQAVAMGWQAGLAMPVVEESGKAIAFLLLLRLAPLALRTLHDGLVVGAYVGLGFQVFDDLLHGPDADFAPSGADQAGEVLHGLLIGSAAGIASHALCAALFAAGLIYVVGTVAEPRRIRRGLGLIATAVAVHLLWDSMGVLTRGTDGLVRLQMTGIAVTSAVALLVALRLAARRERRWLNELLAPEVADGTLIEREVAALTGHRKDVRRHLLHYEYGTKRTRAEHVLRAARALAHEVAVSGGNDNADVLRSRAEIARLRGPAVGEQVGM